MRIIAAIVLVAVLAVGGGIVATTAYQAGVNTAVTQAAADGATVVNPVVVPAYGYGWHPFGVGFGFFGFLFTLFFLFIVFGLIRAIFWGGRGHRHGWGGPGWGGPGWGGPGWDNDARRDHFASKYHRTFEDWHRQAHDAPAGPNTNAPTTNPPTSTPPAG